MIDINKITGDKYLIFTEWYPAFIGICLLSRVWLKFICVIIEWGDFIPVPWLLDSDIVECVS